MKLAISTSLLVAIATPLSFTTRPVHGQSMTAVQPRQQMTDDPTRFPALAAYVATAAFVRLSMAVAAAEAEAAAGGAVMPSSQPDPSIAMAFD